eukprot:Seg652.2 transcript_id=Seg652.2/GoldUCD/mRNA.D3Y31 product="hypothetical protein" protein_id=Seg652.2/GoldUCD/D3Y31
MAEEKKLLLEMDKSVGFNLSSLEMHDESSGRLPKKLAFSKGIRWQSILIFFGIVILVTGAMYLAVANRSVVFDTQSQDKIDEIFIKKNKDPKPKINDPQDCINTGARKTFPDIDYATFGYNIIRGFPLAIGHDPGLTRPIFKADYSDAKITSDCRYSVPKGWIVVPDVSCVASFSSNIVKDTYELTKAIEASVEVSGGGFWVEFSASTEFKHMSSVVSSRQFVYVNSQARCDYYLSTLDVVQPPPLDPSFIIIAKAIQTQKDVFDFLDLYGTHFLKQVTFGARFVFEDKMKTSDFQTMEQNSVDVKASASYAGLMRIGGSAHLSYDERVKATEYRKYVETSVVSVGAVPSPNGGHLVWASKVKENPIPTKYKLAEIDDLFTANYMEGTGIDYTTISQLIKSSKSAYCNNLQTKGELETCHANGIQNVVTFKEWYISGNSYRIIYHSYTLESCIASCLREEICIAASHWIYSHACYLYSYAYLTGSYYSEDVSIILTERLYSKHKMLSVNSLKATGLFRQSVSSSNVDDCRNICHSDNECFLFTFEASTSQCLTYPRFEITTDSLVYQDGVYMEIPAKSTSQQENGLGAGRTVLHRKGNHTNYTVNIDVKTNSYVKCIALAFVLVTAVYIFKLAIKDSIDITLTRNEIVAGPATSLIVRDQRGHEPYMTIKMKCFYCDEEDYGDKWEQITNNQACQKDLFKNCFRNRTIKERHETHVLALHRYCEIDRCSCSDLLGWCVSSLCGLDNVRCCLDIGKNSLVSRNVMHD